MEQQYVSAFPSQTASICAMSILTNPAEAKPVLKPAEFQNFELTEKTIISHNVAM